MNTPRDKTLWLCTRDPSLSTLWRAALASQQLTPLEWPPESVLVGQAPDGRINPPPESVLLLDLAWTARDRRGSAALLRRAQALAWRPRLLLVAPTARPLWNNEQNWARAFTGRDLLPRPLATQPESVSRFLAALLADTGHHEADWGRLETHLRVLLGSAPEPQAPRTMRPGSSPAELAAALAAEVQIADSSYRLKKYPQCFIGREAVDWLARSRSLSREDAVFAGEGLRQAGLLHHVVKDQPFRDGDFFYRVAVPGHFDAVAFDAALGFLNQAPGLIADRSWRGAEFPQCLVGTEAVDALSARFRLTRAEATVLGQSLLEFGLLRHVADEHPFADDYLFYRLAERSGTTANPLAANAAESPLS